MPEIAPRIYHQSEHIPSLGETALKIDITFLFLTHGSSVYPNPDPSPKYSEERFLAGKFNIWKDPVTGEGRSTDVSLASRFVISDADPNPKESITVTVTEDQYLVTDEGVFDVRDIDTPVYEDKICCLRTWVNGGRYSKEASEDFGHAQLGAQIVD